MSDRKALSLDKYDRVTLLCLLDRFGEKHSFSRNPQTDENLMYKCCLDAAKMIRSLDQSAKALCDVVGGHFMHAVKPTHYAVIDEHGEIVHSAKVNNIEDALKQCNLFLTMMRQGEIGQDFKDWTVKGVTVHG